MQNNFLVYKSSAGSGKTFTLVKEYLKIVLSDKTKIKNVLAITFTNAASAEMKHRIIEALGKLSDLKNKNTDEWSSGIIDLKNILEEETKLTSEQIIENAGEVLKLILHNYADFAVSTIDSFTHRIIRTFAFDLQIPFNFDIEMDSNALLGQAIDLLIGRVGNENEESLTKLMLAFMERMTDDEKKLSLEKEIMTLAQTIHEEDIENNIQKLKSLSLEDFLEIQKKLVAEIKIFEKTINTIAADVVRIVEEESISDKAFFQGKKGIANYFPKLAAQFSDKDLLPNSYVKTTIEEDKWTSPKATTTEIASLTKISPVISDAYYKIQEIAENGIEHYRLLKLINKNIFPLAVLNELENVLSEIKSENSLLHISDFNKKIAEIVALQPVPFIYERLGEKYRHYMIDEFQDTSMLQWQNLLPLIENALANGNMNLVVGDCKQAIYRWRGGEVEQFAILPKIPEKIKAVSKASWEFALKSYYNEKKLETNYRSYKEIVSFNNSFFEFVKEDILPDSMKSIYEGYKQNYLESKQGGLVHLEFMQDIDGDTVAKKEVTLNRIVEIINDLHNDKGHPLSDITILCRANDEANLTARFLLENNINVISSESLLLSFSPDVNFFISFLKLLKNSSDLIAFTELLNYLIKSKCFKNKNSIHEVFRDFDIFPVKKKENPDERIQKLEKLLIQNGYSISFSYLKKLNLWDICEAIVSWFFADSDQINPFIAFFMDAVYDFLDKNPSSIDDFLQWWDEVKSKYSVVLPKGVEAVQVITIHKAKGLQFPVVIYPFAKQFSNKLTKKGFWANIDSLIDPEFNSAYIMYDKTIEGTYLAEHYTEEKQKTLLDLLNVVYVAFTRPVEKLFILSNIPKNGKFKEGSLPLFLHNFLEKRGLWIEDKLAYTFGDNEIASESSQPELLIDTTPSPENIFVGIEKYISNDWRERIRVKPTTKTAIPEDEVQAAMIRGKLMHKVMERIYTSKDVPFVLNQMLINGEINASEKEKLFSSIMEIIGMPEISSCFDENIHVKNEAAIMDEKGEFFRPDRVVLKKSEAIIIDYKTGTPSDSYKKQIMRYKSLLGRMGYGKIKAYLVYLDKKSIEKV